MGKSITKRTIIFTLILNLIATSLPQIAHAELIGTQTLIELQDRENRVVRINSILAQEEVRNQLIMWGVDPAEAQARVAALTDSELQTLEQHLDHLPAGGEILAIIGIIFIVLLILELVGVTNIFSKL